MPCLYRLLCGEQNHRAIQCPALYGDFTRLPLHAAAHFLQDIQEPDVSLGGGKGVDIYRGDASSGYRGPGPEIARG